MVNFFGKVLFMKQCLQDMEIGEEGYVLHYNTATAKKLLLYAGI